MPLPVSTRNEIIGYAQRDLPEETWFLDYFDFVTDTNLRKRLGAEFWSARLIYKLLESVRAMGGLQRAQIKLQVLQYASMYEAILHYLLFHVYHDTAVVRALMESPRRTKVAVSRELRAKLVLQTNIPESQLVVSRETVGKTDVTKIRFDAKAQTAVELGLITEALRDDLVEVFSARNAIHLHAEIKKNLNYQLELSKKAYRRMQPLKKQIVARLRSDGRI